MFRALALALFSLLLTAAPASASDYIIGGGSGVYLPSARLFVNGWGYCTSTIISPQWILTAKHCATTGGTMTFYIGSTSATGGRYAEPAQVVLSQEADIALVRLDRSVSNTYARLAESTPQYGAGVTIYGWGATSRCPNELDCQSQKLKAASATHAGPAQDYAGGIGLRLNAGDGAVAGGDSGGPVVYNGVQVGVTSASDRETYATATSVSAYRGWIRQVSGV
ncbi:trypsin [Pseudonocardiaceae bacterium YIM PH 21723]|nr:trypsin [Pseudonocardiaceae bacterium YIM PH 21723]